MGDVSARQAAEDMKRELRRSVWVTRGWMGLVALLLGAVLTDSRGVTLDTLGLIFVLTSQLGLAGLRWWPAERAWREVRLVTEAVPVEVVTDVWQPPLVVATGTGERWTWRPIPGRLHSPFLPRRGDDTWLALPLTEGARPTTLSYDRDLSRPRITTTFKAAQRLTTSSPAPEHGESAPDVRS